jgi:hypothetical protein
MRVAGESVGLVLLSLLGALLTAAAAWWLVGEIEPRWSRPAFWLAGLGPVLFSAYITWAHSLSAGLAGVSLVAFVRMVERGPRWTRTVGLAAALAGGVLLRSEAVLWAGAVLAVLAGVALVRRKVHLVEPLAVAALAVGASMAAERRWVAHIIGGAAPHDLVLRSSAHEPGWVEARLQGFWHATLEGPAPIEALMVVLVAIVTVVVVRAHRRSDELASGALGGLALLTLLVWLREPMGMTRGLLAAAPVLVIGVALLLGSRRCPPTAGLVLAGCGVFAGAVYATQYADGGAFQWGGRFFSPALVPLAVVAAGGLRTAWEARPAASRMTFARAAGSLVAVGALVAVGSLGASRAGIEPLYQFVAESASPVNVTTAAELPRMMWREDLPWLRADRGGDLRSLLRTLHEQGASRVTLVTPPSSASAAAERWRVTDEGPVGATPLHLFVLRR